MATQDEATMVTALQDVADAARRVARAKLFYFDMEFLTGGDAAPERAEWENQESDLLSTMDYAREHYGVTDSQLDRAVHIGVWIADIEDATAENMRF